MKKILYIDYECKVGERVQWNDISGKHFEGVILAWNETYVATVLLDDDTKVEIQC